MSVRVRCHECKEALLGWETGQRHAQLTGHVWQPAYYCSLCDATFPKFTDCNAHILTRGLHASVSGRTGSSQPATASVVGAVTRTPLSEVLTCGRCREQFRDARTLASHREIVHPPTTQQHASTHGFHQCSVCKVAFVAKDMLDKHLTSHVACTTCRLYLESSDKLQDHYRDSPMHPTCKSCGVSFETLHEWSNHRADCKPATPPSQILQVPASVGETQHHATQPAAIAEPCDGDECPKTTPGPPDEHEQIAELEFSLELESDATACASSASETPSLASDSEEEGSPPYTTPVSTPTKLARSDRSASERAYSPLAAHDVSSTDPTQSDGGVSARYDVRARMFGVLQGDSHTAGPDYDVRASSSRSRSLVDTASLTEIDAEVLELEDSYARTVTRHPGSKTATMSFHCRMCHLDPCVEPVTTMCGHLFCRSCIVQELATNLCCPVCSKPFLVPLYVDM